MNVYKNVNICNKSKIKSSQLLVCKVKQSEKLATKFLKVFFTYQPSQKGQLPKVLWFFKLYQMTFLALLLHHFVTSITYYSSIQVQHIFPRRGRVSVEYGKLLDLKKNCLK